MAAVGRLNEPLYGQDEPRQSQMLKDVENQVRLDFVRKVYGILTMQILFTALIATPISTMDKEWLVSNSWLLLTSSIMTLVTIVVMVCCQQVTRQYPTNYIFLSVFTFFEAITIGFVCAQYTVQSVLAALFVTAAIFGFMTLFAWTTTTDFTGCGPYLFGVLMCMCLMGLAMSMMSFCGIEVPLMEKVYACVGVVLFTIYIIVDTQMMIGGFGGHKIQFEVDDYVFAALNLYLDLINLFVFLLELFGDKR